MNDNINPSQEEPITPAASFNEWLGEVAGDQNVSLPVDAIGDHVVSIVTTAGGSYDVPVASDELLTVREVLERSNLPVAGAVEFWVNGVRVVPDFQVASGARVSVVGVVKGG